MLPAAARASSRPNRGVIHPGEVQVMSAGKGIRHSEYNHSKEKPVHLLQIWIVPRSRGPTPRWEQRLFTFEERSGKLLPVVSDGGLPGTLRIDQDAQVYVSSLAAGQQMVHTSQPGRKAYLFTIAGELAVNGVPLAQGDQGRIAHETEIKMQARKDSELILLDLPEVAASF